MAERAHQLPEPPKIIQLYPEAPIPIWIHKDYKFQVPSTHVIPELPTPVILSSAEGGSEESVTVNQLEPTKWQVPEDFEGIMAFNPRHYVQAYLDLRAIKSKISPAEYQVRLQQQNRLTLHDLEKTVLERLIASQSIIHYRINENGRLVSGDFAVPALERYERGQQWLEENGSNEVEREKAEVAGMYKVEALLATGQDMTIVVASARSEGCKHGEEKDPKDEPEDVLYHQQYFNVFAQSEGKITMTQYHSTHETEKLLSTLQEVDPQYPHPEEAENKASFMLLNPAVLTKSFAEIQEKFAINLKNTTPPDECAVVLQVCTPVFESLIKTLTNNTLDIVQIKKTINTIYDLVDKTEEEIKRLKVQEAKRIARGLKIGSLPGSTPRVDQGELRLHPGGVVSTTRNNPIPIQVAMSAAQLIEKHGYTQPKAKGGACPGKQKSFKITGVLQRIAKTLGAKSVVDFANMADDDEDEEVVDFECGGPMPDGTTCTYVVKAYSGKTECPECHRKAVCV